MTHTILGIHIKDRQGKVPEVQQSLSKYACNIKTRIGLHDIHGDECSTTGVILLEVKGKEEDISALKDELGKHADVQEMVFED